jgi:hypothetical protein
MEVVEACLFVCFRIGGEKGDEGGDGRGDKDDELSNWNSEWKACHSSTIST